MTNTDYQIYADDGTMFCMRHQSEDGEVIVQGPKGKTLSVTNLIKQIYNPAVANEYRGKKKIKKR